MHSPTRQVPASPRVSCDIRNPERLARQLRQTISFTYAPPDAYDGNDAYIYEACRLLIEVDMSVVESITDTLIHDISCAKASTWFPSLKSLRLPAIGADDAPKLRRRLRKATPAPRQLCALAEQVYLGCDHDVRLDDMHVPIRLFGMQSARRVYIDKPGLHIETQLPGTGNLPNSWARCPI